mmetsp:Transcript_4292/g.11976  ORF Transcript_4292/g.11976 Transcript_4292/m.11976 type:complete len:548 (+) Transcript_4292:85-1728(+)
MRKWWLSPLTLLLIVLCSLFRVASSFISLTKAAGIDVPTFHPLLPIHALHAFGNGISTADVVTSETMDSLEVEEPLLPSFAPSHHISRDEFSSTQTTSNTKTRDSDKESQHVSDLYIMNAIDFPRDPTPNATDIGMSRRRLFQQGITLLVGGTIIGGSVLRNSDRLKRTEPAILPTPSTMNTKSKISGVASKQDSRAVEKSLKRISPVNITQVVAETAINVTLDCEDGCVSVDAKNFTKIQTKKVPNWYPAYLIPPPKVIKEISNGELLVAATIAGAVTEMFRTSLLYPLQTVKTRIQTDVHNFTARTPTIEERFVNLGKNVRRHVQEGNLYAGLKPTLLISVPASGVYFGVRDVCKRTLGMMPFLNDVEIILMSALIADVVSLCFRTPADTLALRLQDQNDDVGDWVGDSLKRLPSVIMTDLPYLLSKIFLGRQFIHGSLSIDRYAEYAIVSAVVAAILTTPFDVARTRILVDSDGDFTNGKDGGSGEGVLKTMISITKEGQGGIANLFAGWFERVLYLGIGRAWLEPIQIIAYVGMRDTILLGWF